MLPMQKITTFLWFDNNAEEAMNFYTSIFPNSHIAQISRYGDGAPMPKGTFLVGTFYLNDQEFMALNGGANFRFTPAISLMVHCETQAEVDYYWDKLTSGGGKPGNCGWLEDKFGLSWQVVPSMLGELMSKGDAVRSGRMLQELMKMDKLVIADLQRAYEE